VILSDQDQTLACWLLLKEKQSFALDLWRWWLFIIVRFFWVVSPLPRALDQTLLESVGDAPAVYVGVSKTLWTEVNSTLGETTW